MKEEKGLTDEEIRLLEAGVPINPWEKWGPYVSERSWGTVREDYSQSGNVWESFTFEMAPFRCYRWGEDGIAGLCDRYQVMVLAQSFWNGKDPILKERLFGLGAHEGNHGEDVKEYYYHLDCTPSHSYMKYLYKYPCSEFPYEELFQENQVRSKKDPEYELLDTGVFKDNRYFDIFIEYAKASEEDICVKVEFFNRSAKDEVIDYIPQLFFRNTWSWGDEKGKAPQMKEGKTLKNVRCIESDDYGMDPIKQLNFEYRVGRRYFYADSRAETLFTNNETNQEHLYEEKNTSPYVKDAFNRYVILKDKKSLNPKKEGSKAAFYFKGLKILAGTSEIIYLRFTNTSLENPLHDVEKWVQKRKEEADTFYEKIYPVNATADEKNIYRQGISGMLWNKQIYLYDVSLWLKGDHKNDPELNSPIRKGNSHWKHLVSKRILSMPDKWEYPWFAAWDLAFHTITLALVDMKFAKEQLWYLLFDQFQHPNGQVPAYEWEFSDLNPPVQGWAALRLFKMEENKTGKRDVDFLKKCFHKLLLNFAWWVNRVDTKGNNVFEGGFLGLDNITLIDRSQKLPHGGRIEQSDGTGWMGLFCLTLMRMSLELAQEDSVYEGMAIKFFEHFIYISNALVCAETRKVQNWSNEDGFFYDVIHFPGHEDIKIKVRSLVGIIPLFAVDTITPGDLEAFPEFKESFHWFLSNRAKICKNSVSLIEKNGQTHYLLTLMDLSKVKQVLTRVWDPKEFRSSYGLRSLSKYYEKHPYELLDSSIQYEPGEALSALKGGNSNWRGPIWFPTSFLLIESLQKLHFCLGDQMQVQVGSEKAVHLGEMARYFAEALIALFRKDKEGNRPIFENSKVMQKDPHFHDYILFYEHFHGESGRGIGASHQTGWSGLVANLIDEWCQ